MTIIYSQWFSIIPCNSVPDTPASSQRCHNVCPTSIDAGQTLWQSFVLGGGDIDKQSADSHDVTHEGIP